MDLGMSLAEALEAEGLAVPVGSGAAAGSLQAAAEAFLAKVREAERAEANGLDALFPKHLGDEGDGLGGVVDRLDRGGTVHRLSFTGR